MGVKKFAEEAKEVRVVEEVGFNGNEIEEEAGCDVNGSTGSVVDIGGWTGGAGDGGEEGVFSMVVGNDR